MYLGNRTRRRNTQQQAASVSRPKQRDNGSDESGRLDDIAAALQRRYSQGQFDQPTCGAHTLSTETLDRTPTRPGLPRSFQITTLERLRNRVLGYDIFVSYSHLDGLGYATALEKRLREIDLTCFRDAREMPVGSHLDEEISRAISRSQMLVVVGTPAAAASEWVAREVQQFRTFKRPLFVIDVGGAIAARQPWKGAEALVYQPEGVDNLTESRPSDLTVDAIQHAVTFRTRNQVGRRLLSAIALVVAALTSLFVWQFAQTRLEARIAESHRIVTLSESIRERNPQLSLLLAVEAAAIAERAGDPVGISVEQAIRDALAVQGGRGLVSPRGELQETLLSPDGRWLAASTKSRVTLVWDLRAPQGQDPVRILEDEKAAVSPIGFDANSRKFLSLSGGRVSVWDLNEKWTPGSGAMLPAEAESVVMSRSRRWLAMVSNTRKEILVWDLSKSDRQGADLRLPTASEVGGVAFSSDEHALAFGVKGEIHIVPLDGRTDRKVLTGHAGLAQRLSFSAGRAYVIGATRHRMVNTTGDFSSLVQVWRVDAPSAPILRTEAMSFDMSPDEAFFAAGYSDFSAKLWNLTETNPGRNVVTLLEGRDREDSYARTRMNVQFTRDGTWLIVAGKELPRTYLWRMSRSGVDEKCLRLDDDSGAAQKSVSDPKLTCGSHLPRADLIFPTPDSRWLVTGDAITGARLWRLTGDDLAASAIVLRRDENSLGSVAIADDSRTFVTVQGTTARVWETEDLERLQLSAYPLGTPADAVESSSAFDKRDRVVISADGHWMASGGKTAAFLWDLTKEPTQMVTRIGGLPLSAWPLRFSSDSKQLLIASGDSIRIWRLDAERPRELKAVTLPAAKEAIDAIISHIDLSPDGRWLAAAAAGTVWLWDLRAPDVDRSRTALRGHLDWIQRMEFSGDGGWLISASHSSNTLLRSEAKLGWTTRLWRVSDTPPTEAITLPDPPGALLLTTGGNKLVTAVDKTAYLWTLSGRHPDQPRTLESCPGPVTEARITDNGQWLIGTATVKDAFWLLEPKSGKYTCVWNLRTPGAAIALYGHATDLDSRLSSEGHRLLTSGIDGVVFVWDLTAPAAPVRLLKGHQNFVDVVRISPNGRWLLTGSSEIALLWDLARAADTPVADLRGHMNISSATFSADSSRLATADFKNILLWDLTSPHLSASRLTLAGGHTEGPLAFTRDGRWLAAAQSSRTSVYAVRLDDLLKAARRTLGRNLTPQEWSEYFPLDPYRETFAVPSRTKH